MIRVDDVALALREPGAEQLEEVGAWLRAVRTRAGAIDTRGVTFLVLSPLALPERRRLAAELASLGVEVRGRMALPGWPRVATAFRVAEGDPGPRRLRAAVLYEHAWETLCPGLSAEAWALPPGGHARVERLKRRLRAPLRHLRVDFGVPGIEARLLGPLHVADGGEAQDEARRLLAAVGLLDPTPRPAPT